LDLTHDICGRERHRTYRDDMGGVGSFARDNRTLYVTGLKRSNNLEEIVTGHFIEWGELEHIKVVWDKAIAFVKYKLRSAAEFAKESMQDQSLDGDEVVSIRWANEDPNPSGNKDREDAIELAKAAAERNELAVVEPEAAAQSYDYSQYYAAVSEDNQRAVSEWLKQLELEQYVSGFFAAGYNEMQTLSQLDEYGLDSVGVADLDHRVKLLTSANELATSLSSYDYSAYYQYYQYYSNPNNAIQPTEAQPQYSIPPPTYSFNTQTQSSTTAADAAPQETSKSES